jgi:hypothetical protein
VEGAPRTEKRRCLDGFGFPWPTCPWRALRALKTRRRVALGAGGVGDHRENPALMNPSLRSLVALAVISTILPFAPAARAQTEDTPLAVARRVEPVVLTGAQLPTWSRLPATGVAKPYPSGANTTPGSDEVRDAHNGTLVVPPDVREGAPVDSVAAYAWNGEAFEEIPVQVDEKFPYFLANGRSDFAFYSGTDEELTYEWDVESGRRIAGECAAAYPPGESAMEDPVATLDDDDEVVFMADDAGVQAPLDALGPAGTAAERQEVRLVDPLDPTAERFVYLFQKEGGSGFNASNGYVQYQRDDNADEYIDRNSFADADLEKLGTSNTGYGPNLPGTVCNDDPDTPEVETIRNSTDRFPRDGVTVTTDSYRWRATGRWMVREMQVTKPGTARNYGPDLIDRWKGRAFQQSPDSTISLVGFEDEQVNWEGNSSLLGELAGPVRAIREVWGADSGTNVTKTETFYRDSILYRYRVRVHPIPPDGLYTSWDYNHDQVETYFNEIKTDGVAIDGQNDDVGSIDEAPLIGPAFFDVNDPTFNKPLSFDNWEQVAGKGDNGSLVYMFQMNNAQSLENPLVVPYYRDDSCLDDGTGDNPSPRPWPGEAQTDSRLADYMKRKCYGDPALGEKYSLEGPWRQGCFACHGIHYFVTNDTDNTFSPAKTTEIDGQQWQWAAPTEEPTNVGDRYANTAKAPLVAVAATQANTAGEDEPTATTLEVVGDDSGQIGDPTTLAARLTDGTAPIEGKEVTFSLRGRSVGIATTDADGVATIQTAVAGPAESTVQSASFSGDDDFAASSVTAPFTVQRDDSALTLSLSSMHGRQTATAVLTDADSSAALAGRTIDFAVNGQKVASGSTDGSGRATATFKTKKADRVTAAFAGDDSYNGAQASR